MTDETTTNLVEADDTPEADGTEGFVTGVEQDEAQADENEPTDDGDPEDDAEDEEVELDTDLKLKVPKAAAAKLKELQEGNLRQADYTRKTQEVAELRKAVDAERASVYQANEAELGARAQIVALNGQIAQYEKVDWDAYEQESPFDAQSDWRRYQSAKGQRDQLAGQLQYHVQQRTVAQQQETAKLIDQGRAVLAKDIPGWSDTLAATLLDTGVRQYGFDRAEIEEFTDPRMVKVLHDAHQFHLLQAKQKKTASIAKGQEVTPATTLKGTSGRAPVSGATKDFAAFEKLASK